jgi:hypothetical protein
MPSKGHRVLLLGTSGTNKNTVIKNLRDYRKKEFSRDEIIQYDFERILTESQDIRLFNWLDASERRQRDTWNKGWKNFKRRFCDKDQSTDDVFLNMHGVITRRNYGIRSPINIRRLVDGYDPTIVVTLIDDVYRVRHNIHERAGDKRYEGHLTLEDIFTARQASIFLGGLISKQINDWASSTIPHYVISVWHPARVLDKLLRARSNLTTAYTAFPITIPRKYKGEGMLSLKNEINDILRDVSEFASRENDFTFFCPLTIDEYPLLFALDNADKFTRQNQYGNEVTYMKFSTGDRWNVRSFYGEDTILLTDDENEPNYIDIPIDEVEAVDSFIRSDVGTRDYKLVSQSDLLNAYNPVVENLDGKHVLSGGVKNEIRYALNRAKRKPPVHVYQNKDHDPNDILRDYYYGQTSTGSQIGSNRIIIHHSLKEHLENLP